MRMNKSKRILSSVALILILAMVIGTIASALTGCGAVEKKDDTVIRIGGMKGATTIGLVNLVDRLQIIALRCTLQAAMSWQQWWLEKLI